ncbi:Poly [Spathaspora sp. JA1]|nr:Poly [Spathaspora sp. JA1]
MSIIPYNSNSDILFHDPNHGILVVHDSQENSISLVSTRSSQQKSRSHSQPQASQSFTEYDNYPNKNPIKCPSCGFTWSEYTRDSPRGNSSSSSSPQYNFSLPDINLPRDFAQGFVRNDYFKLLSQLPYGNHEGGSSSNNHSSSRGGGGGGSIPEGMFNQGYFKRFFKKVEPFILGSGAHAQVYKVDHVLNDIKLGTYAVKRISIGGKFEHLEHVLNEVLILYELSVKGANENNLIRYNHVWLELGDLEDSSSYFLGPSGMGSEKRKSRIPYVFILQQYCDGGHLEDLITKHFRREENLTWQEKIALERMRRRSRKNSLGGSQENQTPKKKWLSNFEIWKFFHDVANGVHYLHVHGILHRDLKPSNCLLDVGYVIREEDNEVKEEEKFLTVEEFEARILELPKVLVSDFGEGKFIDKQHNVIIEDEFSERRGNTGTLEFTAPELWLYSNDPTLGEENKTFFNDFTYESDIYSLGLILLYLCVGKLPFSDIIKQETDPQEIRGKIIDWYYELTYESFQEWFTSNVLELRDSIDETMLDFQRLIYMMIKGEGSEKGTHKSSFRAISKEVLEFLETMKRNRFIKHYEEASGNVEDDIYRRRGSETGSLVRISSSRASGGSAVDEPGVQEDEEEEDDIFEEQHKSEHLNLIESVRKLEPPSNQIGEEASLFASSSVGSIHQVFPATILYGFELILLEYVSYNSPKLIHSILKVVIFCLVFIELYLQKTHNTLKTGLLVKQKKKQLKLLSNQLTPGENKFEKLANYNGGLEEQDEAEEDSDSSVIFDFQREGSKDSEIILVDSEEEEEEAKDDIIVISDTEKQGEDVEPPHKKRKVEENELTNNEDFIGFGFSSSSDEAEDNFDDFSDDGVLSADEQGITIDKSKKSLYPWIKDHDHSTQKEIADWLTMEIKDFVDYVSPSSDEIVTRNTVVNRLKEQIAKFWPGTEVHVFGSCATDLYLPGSDIDMVVISQTGDYENRSRLYQLSSFLRSKKLAKNIEVIANAKVPIIKFIDPESDIHIDVSFERTNGLDAARRIRKWLVTTPGLRELILIVKQFLRSRRLNNVHVGGLGGYATIIMCYHFLRLHPKISTGSIDILDNLGVLLIEFFELYGRNFSYDNLIISLDPETEEPRYLTKGSRYSSLNTARSTFSIVIQDPADAHNNITRSSYNLRDLKKAFGGAYQLLVEKCYQLNGATYKSRLGQSILGDIIRFKGKERDFNDDRHKVVNDALVNHQSEEEEEIESDGLEGNDKYYFSDMTVESEEEEDQDSDSKYVPREPTPVTNKAKDTKKLVESFLSLEDSENEESNKQSSDKEEDSVEIKRTKSNLDKDIKRDYWRQKGLDM